MGVVGRDQGAGVAARVQLDCGWRGQGAAGHDHGAAGWAQLGRGQGVVAVKSPFQTL
jgi:hypothetical protein